MNAWIALGLLVMAGLILILRHDVGTIAGFDTADFAGLIAGLALLIYLGGSLISDYRGRLMNAMRDIVLWGALGLVLIACYSYRIELINVAHRVMGELTPPGTGIPVATGQGQGLMVKIRRRPDGHFIVRTNINDTAIHMIVDTGASTVVLRDEDARRIGIDTARLVYAVPVRTANGTSTAARVRLNEIFVGAVGANNIEALVTPPGTLHQSLLGMSFLSRLRSYEFSGDFLTLRG